MTGATVSIVTDAPDARADSLPARSTATSSNLYAPSARAGDA
jgi:hypothetical protein